MITPGAKGLALEDAVRRIEEAIVANNPALSHAPFKIQARDRIRVADVLHEIDLSVRIAETSGYESLHIFECKNWKKPVGKNEVIVFAAKVAAVGATRGYLVAGTFTRDAAAQAALDRRLVLLHCSTDFSSPLESLQPAASTSDFLSLKATVQLRDGFALEADDFFGVFCWTENRGISLAAYSIALAELALREFISRSRSLEILEGLHVRPLSRTLSFAKREFIVMGADAEWLRVDAVVAVHSRVPVIVSKFDVENRGRTFTYEAPAAGTLPKLTVEIIETRIPKQPSAYTMDLRHGTSQ